MASPSPCTLFLDVDGVLHPLEVGFRDGRLGVDHCFAPDCMQQLVRVVKTTGAEIVLSSSWRRFDAPRQRLSDALAAHGLRFTHCTTTANLDGTRASQILAFMHERALTHSRPWVVLDDEDVTSGRDSMMMQVVRSRFVQTDSCVGLTASDADRAIAILSDSSGDSDD